MKGLRSIGIWFVILLALVTCSNYAQQTPKFKPYTIETTFQKLKKHYPFISPITPIVSDKITARENVIYKKVKGSILKLDIYQPHEKSRKRFPAVLLIHGGGWLTGGRENERPMAQHLALNGFVAVPVSYRLGLEAPYPAAVLDLKDAIRWLRKHAKKYRIDPDKIAVLGASAGGQLANLIGVTPNSSIYGKSKISDSVQAIVNIDGITSFIHPEAAAEGTMASIWLGGTRKTNWKNWKEASALKYVNKNTPPTLFINSSKPRFHAGRDDMITLLNKYHIFNDVHTLPDTPHSFWLMHPWFETTLDYTLEFLNKVFNQ